MTLMNTQKGVCNLTGLDRVNSNISTSFLIKLYVKIADNKFQFLNCVIGQKYLKTFYSYSIK